MAGSQLNTLKPLLHTREDPVLSQIVTGVFGNLNGFLPMLNDTASNLGTLRLS